MKGVGRKLRRGRNGEKKAGWEKSNGRKKTEKAQEK